MKLAAILASVAALAGRVESYTNPITIKGYKMYDAKTGDYFSAKGIDYYPRPNTGELNENNVDFFTDDHASVWEKDIEYLAATGANAVRLYAVDPTKSHDMFMCALRAKGMYALIDLGASCKGCSISNDKYPTCYPSTLKDRGEQIILAFAKYDNVLAFSAGNEVNHVVTDPTMNAPCQKKFIRDMRKFTADCSKTMRSIPVGVVLADHERDFNALYYSCRTNVSDTYENAEWYGLNAYLSCDPLITDGSKATGLLNMLNDFLSYKMPIPVLLTEFGCLNKVFSPVGDYEAQRTWLEAGWISTDKYREVLSGGFAFEYSTEYANAVNENPNKSSEYPFKKYGPGNWGLGYFSPKNCDHGSEPCTYKPMPNYENLKAQYNVTATTNEPKMASFVPATDRVSPPPCPTNGTVLAEATWPVDSVQSYACPAVALSFTCPNQASSGIWVGTTLLNTTETPSTTTPTTTTPDTTKPATATAGTLASATAAVASFVVTTCMAISVAFT
uniref:Glycoside hydrolase family 5 domain-containing protein n=1 Tax=Globisporangium ultimum (strain ATCC 200006 / CBS 805.95 / DAOM BR144) TaxID=431595 RepID=K3WUU2_GLOUD